MRLLKDSWSLDEVESALPEGLGGAYWLIMKQLTSALRKDRPELLSLLMEKVLPVLVAGYQPLSPEIIAWACSPSSDALAAADLLSQQQRTLDDVKELLNVGLASLFPCRPAVGWGEGIAVQPYHKSVLDWFKCVEGFDAGEEFKTGILRGHRLLWKAGEAHTSRMKAVDVGLTPDTSLPLASSSVAPPPPSVVDQYALRYTLLHNFFGSSLTPIDAGGPFDEWLAQQLASSLVDPKDTDEFKYINFTERPPFTALHKSLMRKVLTPEVWEELKDVKTPSGYTLSNAIQPGVLRPHLGLGIVCGDEACFTLFKDVIFPMVKGWHKFDPEAQVR